MTQPERVALAWPEGFKMNLRVSITLKIDLAACLYGLAAIIALLA